MKIKSILMILLLFIVVISVSTVTAADNITLDSDSSVEGEVDMPTERLDIQFNDEKQTLSFKVTDESVITQEKMNYNFYVDGQMKAGGTSYYTNNKSTNYSPYEYIHTLKYYADGEHNLVIKKTSPNSLLFNVTFDIKNNISLSNDITIQNTKTVKYSIKNGVITSSSVSPKLHDGWNNLSEFGLTNWGATKPVILKVYYRGYMVDGVDIRNKTNIYVSSGTFTVYGYDYSNTWSYNSNEIKLSDQTSWDGQYNYQYRSSKTVPTKVKEPIYKWKKVKNGYKWKYYKTKWHKTKIVTHKWKKGKFIVYHNKLRKVKNLLNKNGKITKTVYGSKKTTVYMKYPVDYYKKVRKYKKVRYISGYSTITENLVKEIWVDAKGTAQQIAFRA